MNLATLNYIVKNQDLLQRAINFCSGDINLMMDTITEMNGRLGIVETPIKIEEFIEGEVLLNFNDVPFTVLTDYACEFLSIDSVEKLNKFTTQWRDHLDDPELLESLVNCLGFGSKNTEIKIDFCLRMARITLTVHSIIAEDPCTIEYTIPLRYLNTFMFLDSNSKKSFNKFTRETPSCKIEHPPIELCSF